MHTVPSASEGTDLRATLDRTLVPARELLGRSDEPGQSVACGESLAPSEQAARS